jgi:hypothetical protein
MANRNEKPEETEAAFRAFVRAWGLIRRVMEPVFRGSGISASQWGVLRALRRAEDEGARDLRLTDLGDRLLVRPPSITGVVGRLDRMGLLERRASATGTRYDCHAFCRRFCNSFNRHARPDPIASFSEPACTPEKSTSYTRWVPPRRSRPSDIPWRPQTWSTASTDTQNTTSAAMINRVILCRLPIFLSYIYINCYIQ